MAQRNAAGTTVVVRLHLLLLLLLLLPLLLLLLWTSHAFLVLNFSRAPFVDTDLYRIL